MKKIIIARTLLPDLVHHESVFRRGSVSMYPADTSEEVLHLHRVHHADLIVTEARLPLMGGMKLCSAIRGDVDLRRVSLLVVADKDDQSSAECLALVNAVLLRPLDPIRFFSKISELLVIPRRKDVRLMLHTAVKAHEKSGVFLGMSRNISISGMLIETDRAMRVGETLACSFSLERREINAECRVIRILASEGRYHCGIRFTVLDTASLIIIEQFVKAGTDCEK